MEKEGKYIYCIIETRQERNFGPIGIGAAAEEVLTVGCDDLSMVVSNHPLGKLTANRQNMIAHEHVIETVMQEFDSVLPVRFGTVASGADEIRNLLTRRYQEFKHALADMDHKVELGVKGLWKNMSTVFDEIVEENPTIKKTREAIRRKGGENVQAKMSLGSLVQEALANKKEQQAEAVVSRLMKTACDCKLNKTLGDEMFVNAAFLVDKGREKEFDNLMEDLGNEYKDRARFIYAGPLPVFNFVNIVIYPEQWEK